MRTIKLAIVDDSSFVRKAIQRMLESEAEIQIVGSASSGEELIDNLSSWRPDIITLDLSMPGMGGLVTLDYIMAWKKIPVIILSTHSSKDAPLTIEAMHRGAVDFIDKQQYSLVDFRALRTILIDKIHQFAQQKVSSSSRKQFLNSADDASAVSPLIKPRPVLSSAREYEALVIGASTGGPPAIQQILESLGSSLPVPAAIVQHMPKGFTKAFANRLNAHLPFHVQEARDGDLFQPGTIYIGPSGNHLWLKKEKNLVYIELSLYPDNLAHCPSVDILFSSAALIFGEKILAVLLTGMGKDGAQGMFELAQSGAYTIAQDEESCIVYGMPRAAVQLGAINEELPLNKIGQRIAELLKCQAVQKEEHPV